MLIFRIFAGRRTVGSKQQSIAHDDVRIFRSVAGRLRRLLPVPSQGRGAVCHPQLKRPTVMSADACYGLLRQVAAAE